MIACFGLAACFTTFSYRLVRLQVCKHDEYTELAAEKHVNKQVIHARRGTIQDVNQEMLADNEPIQTVIADGKLISDTHADPAEVAQILAEPLQMDAADLAKKLTTDRRYMIIKKHVTEAQAAVISKRLSVRSLRGIFFEPDATRIYPNGKMLCHVIGFMNSDHKGVQGIEGVMDDYLRGHDGFRYTERDRTGKEIVPYRGQERGSRDGCNVRLTVDMGIQNIVENELDAACAQFKPQMATVIIMRPSTGEILAMANRPNFDLNEVGDGEPEQMKNCAILNIIEPGSTFKIVTAAAALNEKVVTPESMVFCENGKFMFCGKPLHDHHGYGDLSVNDILMKSSNIGAAKLALKLGDQRFYEYIRRFGFGERTGVSLPGEVSGIIHPPHKWAKIDISRIAMGQSVGVTPLQSVAAMSAIANGGRLMMPQIVHEVVDDQGTSLATYPPVEIRRVISEQTAKEVRDALKNVVSEQGTAVLAKVSGFQVAGKTGTAAKINPKGGYMQGKYVVSFLGFLPADKPEFVCLVLLDDAKTSSELNYGGQVAAPIFSRIAEKTARYLNLEPQIEEPAKKIILTQARHD
jgi:cell division protein FtsI (penicillin-binding protein 3)/stage V sporulation protein D (sporulation-specific penicillin-binding protein)